MAFSLLDHLQTTRQTELQALLPTADQASQRELLALVLGQLIVRDRADSNAMYQAIKQHDHAEFWRGLDLNALQPLAQQHGLSTNTLHQVIDQLYTDAATEINSLDDAANFEQAGVSELIQGQAPVQEQAVDLNASMASLSKMMHEASQFSQQPTATQDDIAQDTTMNQNITMNHNTHTADSNSTAQQDHGHQDAHQHPVELPLQRPAPRFFLGLEPLIALAILAAVWIGYLNISSYY
jgi:hypothetical protein